MLVNRKSVIAACILVFGIIGCTAAPAEPDPDAVAQAVEGTLAAREADAASQPTSTTEPTATESDTATPEPSATPTATDTPEPSATPTITPTPGPSATPTATITPTQGPGIGVPADCGNDFTITVLEEPYTSLQLGDEMADGQYILLRLEIQNNTNSTSERFDEEYFELSGKVNNRNVTFALDWDASWEAYWAYQASYKMFSDEVGPGLSKKTMIAFDTNPEATDLALTFAPKDNYFNDRPMCSVTIPLVTNEQ